MKKNIRKLFLLLAVVTTALVCFAVSASALDATGQCGDNVYWEYNSTTDELVISGTGPMYDYYCDTLGGSSPFFASDVKTVVIKSGVTTIGAWAFGGENDYHVDDNGVIRLHSCSNLKSITIPDSVTEIGNYAFSYCDSLTSIIIGDSVTTIGDEAFYRCYSLTSITIGNSVTTIGSDAFYETGYYKNASNWDNNVLYIGKYLIEAKKSLSGDYNIKDSTRCIADYAFQNCTSLTSITIPDSVITIGDSAFYNTGYYNNASNWENNVLYIEKHLIEAKYSISGAYKIKNGTLTIADSAFYGCDSLTSVTIPDSVTTIGDYAFCLCRSLTEVAIGNSVTTIGKYAFRDCDSLASITVPDSVTTIGDYAFVWCVSLTEVTIGNSVTTIGDWAFGSCHNLTEVTIGNSVTTIGDDAFYGCDSLTSVTIPDSVTTIGGSAFYSCGSLTEVIIPDSVTTIGGYAFYYCDSLTDVYYGGTEKQWKNININFDNESLTSANIHYKECTHENKSVYAQQNPTCTTVGYTIGTYCPDCEKWIEGHAVIEKLPHSFTQYIYDENASCTVDGTKTSKCDNCNAKSTIIAENTKTNHKNKVDYPKQNPTCTEIGYTAGTYCPDCEKWLEGHKIIKATGHTFTEKIIDDKHLKSNATVEAAAIYKYDCAACDVISSDKTFTHGKALTLGITGKITVTQTTNSISLTWDKAENATGYRLYYKLPGDLSWRQCISYTTATSYTFNNLPAGQSYRFAVRSAYVKADGGRIYGGYKEIATATKAVAPTKVSSAQNTSKIMLSWNACPGATGYRIFYKSGNSWKICLNATTATSHTFTGLKAGSKFTFAVRPYIVTDSGVVWSDYTTYTASTLPAIPKTAVTSPSSGKITVKWNAVSGAEAYQLYYKTGNGAYKLYKNYFSVQTVSFSGLKSGTKYTFAVRAAKNTSGGWVFGSFTPVSVTVK